MPTLNIEGQRIKVSDDFLKLSPEDQNATVDEIAKSLKIAPKAPDAPPIEADAAAPAGDRVAPGGLRALVTGKVGNPARWSSAEEIGQGATLGAGIPITAAASVPLEMLKMGTLNPAEAYRSVRDRKDADRAAWLEAHPVGGVAANLLGGVATGGGAIEGLTGAATMGGRALQAAGTGAIYGGVTAANEARGDLGEQLKQTAVGAGLGGVTAGLLSPVLEKSIGKVVSLFPSMTQGKVPALTSSGDLAPEAIAAAKAAGLSDEDLANPAVLDRLKQSFADLGTAPSSARQAAADEFGIKLTPGQATQDYQTQKAEQGMLRGLLGDEPQKIVGSKLDPLTGAQTGEITSASEGLGQRLGGSPVAPEGIETALQSEAAKAKAKAQASYKDAFGREGSFDDTAIAPLGESVRGRLSAGDQPTIIDKELTPAASKALGVLDDLSAGKLTNEAAPLGAPRMQPAAAPVEAGKPNPFQTPQTDSGLKPKSLLRYIAEGGGIPNDAEARARDLHKVFVPGAGPLARKGGKDIDGHWRVALQEAGYLPRDLDGYSTSDMRDKLYNALEDELRGKKTYSAADQGHVGVDTTQDAALHNATQDIIAAHKSVGMNPGELHTGAVEDAAKMLASGAEHDPLTAYERAVMRMPDDAVRVGRGNPTRLGTELGVSGTPHTLTAVDQARKKLVAYAQAAAPGSADRRAASQIVDAFDAHLEKAMDDGLFRGDQQAVAMLKQARSQWKDYKGTFAKSGAGDDAGGMIEKIVRGDRSANEITNAIMGANQVGASGVNVRLATKLKKIFGEDSEMMQGIRQSMWAKVTQTAEGKTPFGPQALAQRIDEFVSGKGGEVAKHYFKPDELSAMKRYATVLRMTVPKQGTYSTSGTPGGMQMFLRGMGKGALQTLLPVVGFSHSGPLGAAAMMALQGGAKSALGVVKDRRTVRAAEAVLKGAPVVMETKATARRMSGDVSRYIGKPAGLYGEQRERKERR